MFLKDSCADLKLSHLDNESFEIWWLQDGLIIAISHCPSNYPSTVIHSMEVDQSIK